MQGLRGSDEMFWTFPPTAKTRPDGVKRGCADLLGKLRTWLGGEAEAEVGDCDGYPMGL